MSTKPAENKVYIGGLNALQFRHKSKHRLDYNQQPFKAFSHLKVLKSPNNGDKTGSKVKFSRDQSPEES